MATCTIDASKLTADEVTQLSAALTRGGLPPEIEVVINLGNKSYGPNPFKAVMEHAERLDYLINYASSGRIDLGYGLSVAVGEPLRTWVQKIDQARQRKAGLRSV